MTLKNKFNIGGIVTFKSHPLLYERNIKGDGKLVPPFMIIKEVFFEDKKKKIVDTSNGKIIGERIKYICIFFDDNKSEFKEVTIYESMLESHASFHIARIEGEKKEESDNYQSLLNEVSKYKPLKYEYGKLVCFKTKKLELFKKRTSTKKEVNKVTNSIEEKQITQYVVNYSTPDFVICGYKEDVIEDLFYPNGDSKKLIPTALIKIKWFNSAQMKFSEQFVPIECFVDKDLLKTTSHKVDKPIKKTIS
jgi:hypothetical protein